jgi:imidazolonepropionase-like amidohydrolase
MIMAPAALCIFQAQITSALIAQAPAPSVVAFTGVIVIDGTFPAPRADQVVVIRGNRIVAAGPRASTAVPPGARVIDAGGKFLIPGLWDMHVHTSVPAGREVLALYVANGVTGVRDMAGEWSQLSDWRREIAAGTLIGPRMVVSGPYLEGGDVPIPHILVRNAADARAAVDARGPAATMRLPRITTT